MQKVSTGLSIALRAIAVHMESIKVTGNNIINVNVPGYSRQRLTIMDTSTNAQDLASMLQRRRVRDAYLDNHIRRENQSLGKWEIKSQLYGQLESIFLEPSDYGLSTALSGFWNSWSDLSNDVNSTVPRSIVIQRGTILSETIKSLDAQLANFRSFADRNVEVKVMQINNLAEGIARTNVGITSAEASGEEASELRDARDLMLEKLSKLVNVNVVERDTGSVAVLIGGRTLVADAEVFAMAIDKVIDNGMITSNVVWEEDNFAVRVSGGELNGLLAVRDETIAELRQDLDTVASTLIDEVNSIHSAGYDMDGFAGLDFFTGTNAASIGVNTLLVGDRRLVSASGTGEPGDNAMAILMADLVDQAVAPNTMTIGTFYSNALEKLGTRSQDATMMQGNSETLLNYLEDQKESVSGVSLDEESANLIRFQNAYRSAVQYLSVVNELMKTLMDIVR